MGLLYVIPARVVARKLRRQARHNASRAIFVSRYLAIVVMAAKHQPWHCHKRSSSSSLDTLTASKRSRDRPPRRQSAASECDFEVMRPA